MTEAMKSITSFIKGSLRAGLKVSFTEKELKEMGIKVAKSKLHLVKSEASQEDFKVCSFKLPVRIIDGLKQKAVKASKPYNVFVREVLAMAARQ